MTRRSARMQSAISSGRSSTNGSSSEQSSAEMSSDSTGVAKEKVLRGKTTCRNLTLVPCGHKLPLEFDSKHRPIGKYKSLYTSHQGVVVRNMALTPINLKSWRFVPNATKNSMVEAVIEKFEVGDDPIRMKVLKKQLGKKWRDFRCALKKQFYDPNFTDDQNIGNKPDYVKAEEWKWLVCDYWGLQKVQELCEKNAERRSTQEMLHRTGRKSFAVVEDEELKLTGEERVNRARMFELAYKGDDEKSRDYIKVKQAKIRKLKAERDEGLNTLSDDDIFDKVFEGEKYGRVAMEFGSKKGTQSLDSESRKEVEDARKEAEDARKEAEDANKKCNELTAQLQTTNDNMRVMQEQMSNMFQMMAARGFSANVGSGV